MSFGCQQIVKLPRSLSENAAGWRTIVSTWRFLRSFAASGSSKTFMATVLVIEDDARILKALERLFVAENFEFRSASHGAEGLQLAASSGADAVILDLMLPGMSGREICRTLKHSFPD